MSDGQLLRLPAGFPLRPRHTLLCLLASSGLASALPGNEPEAAAAAALRQRIPEAALPPLREALATPDLPADERKRLQMLLVEALLRSGDYQEAFVLLEEGSMEHLPHYRFWRGMALAYLDRPDEAIYELHQAETETRPEFLPALRLTLAALSEERGEPGEGLRVLQPLLDHPSPAVRDRARLRSALILQRWKRFADALAMLNFSPEPRTYAASYVNYLRAEILLAQGRFAEAEASFAPLSADQEGAALSLRTNAALGRARALARLDRAGEAISVLAETITAAPDPQQIDAAFAVFRSEGLLTNPRVLTLLEGWSSGTPPDLQAPATFHLSLAFLDTGQIDAATTALARFETDFAHHPLAGEALLTLGEARLRQRRFSEASRLLRQLEGAADLPDPLLRKHAFLQAELHAAQGRFDQASQGFQSGTLLRPDPSGARALYNSALLSLVSGRRDQFEREFQQLTSWNLLTNAPAKADLLLESALVKAGAHDPSAGAELESFAADHPDHPRAPEAFLALAEFNLESANPDPAAARRWLERFDAAPAPAAPFRERADSFRCWLLAQEGLPDQMREAATAFLQNWPDSPRRPEIRLKLAEHFLNAGDAANAVTQFQLLTREFPDSPLAPRARFLAGKAAFLAGGRAGAENAIALWDALASEGGPLAREARFEQALALCLIDNRQGALLLFDNLLATPGLEDTLRHATLLAKGETLYVLSQQPAPPTGPRELPAPPPAEVPQITPRDRLEQAVQVFQEILADTKAPIEIHDEARYRLARCHLQNGDTPAALAALLEVTENGQPAPRSDWTWFFRVGMEALRLLEQEKKWEAALLLARRLGTVDHPRAAEAAAYADRLRLEHFLFED